MSVKTPCLREWTLYINDEGVLSTERFPDCDDFVVHVIESTPAARHADELEALLQKAVVKLRAEHADLANRIFNLFERIDAERAKGGG